MKRTPFYLLLAFLLSGCAVGAQPWQLKMLADQGASPAYRDGFRDGCPSGQFSAGYVYARFQKNFEAYRSTADYREGWDNGFRVCEQRFIH